MKWSQGRLRHGVVAAVAAVVAVGIIVVPTADAARGQGAADTGSADRRILLVDDDSVQAVKAGGADGRGLYLLRSALCRAGADVVVVGPWAQQSGRSRASASSPQVTVGPPTALPQSFAGDCATAPSRGAVLGVCRGSEPCGATSASVSPADVVDVALSAVPAGRFGWSAGPGLVPAIAVSAGTRATSVPDDATYATAARYATGLAGRLLARRGGPQFVEDSVPERTDAGQVALDRFSYAKSSADTYQMSFGPVTPAPVPDRCSDTAALLRGDISVGAVSVNRDAFPDARRLSWLTAGH